jgi:hypothetical protein
LSSYRKETANCREFVEDCETMRKVLNFLKSFLKALNNMKLSGISDDFEAPKRLLNFFSLKKVESFKNQQSSKKV